MIDRLRGAVASVPSWLRATLAIGAFIAVGSWLTITTWQGISSSRGDVGLHTDFRDAVYYPVVALRDHVNPYDAGMYFRHYPVGQEFPLYTPVHLLLHLPLLAFSLSTARAIDLGWNLVLVLGLATQRHDLPVKAAAKVQSGVGQRELAPPDRPTDRHQQRDAD